MALSESRTIFGIHSFAPYNRSTRKPFGILKVLAGSSLALNGELIKLSGGSSRYPFAVEDGLVEAIINLKPKEYPDFLFELFLGKAPTANAAEANGTTTTITNRNGTSTVDATLGIASVSVESGNEADVKFANYMVSVISATTVDLFANSDVNFGRGADLVYQDDLLKVTATALTIPNTGATVSIPNTGLEFTGGSGTVLMVVGDSATFTSRPQNDKSMDVSIGSTNDTPAEFGCVMVASQRGNKEMYEIEAFKCKGVGMPLSLEENAFSEAEIPIQAFYDSALDKVFDVRHVTPT